MATGGRERERERDGEQESDKPNERGEKDEKREGEGGREEDRDSDGDGDKDTCGVVAGAMTIRTRKTTRAGGAERRPPEAGQRRHRHGRLPRDRGGGPEPQEPE